MLFLSCLFSTFTFTVTFQQYEIETSYLHAYSTVDDLSNYTKVNFFFSPPARLCAVTNMAEISSTVLVIISIALDDLDFDLYVKNTFFRLCWRQGHSVSQIHPFDIGNN